MRPEPSLQRRLVREARGAVYVEFLVAFVPLFILFLAICQYALLMVGKLVVQHAASAAVRSAIVVLEDDPKHYGGAPRGHYQGKSRPRSDAALLELLGQQARASDRTSTRGGARLQVIRSAAYAPLAAVAPSHSLSSLFSVKNSLAGAIGSDPLTRLALGYAVYNRAAAAVTLPAAPGSKDPATEPIPRDAEVTVRVTYLFHCGVPIAAALICQPLHAILGMTDVLPNLREVAGAGVAPEEAARTLSRLGKQAAMTAEQRRLAKELEKAEMPALQLPLLVSGERFFVLQAEATLPNQGAGYY